MIKNGSMVFPTVYGNMPSIGAHPKSGLTLHDFRRTTEQIGCDMSRRVIAGNRGK